MHTRLVDIKRDLDEKELQAKIAAVNTHWGDDEDALAILCDAMQELEKAAEAGDFGDAGLSESQLLSMGVLMTERLLDELSKEAAEDSDVEDSDVEDSTVEDSDVEDSDVEDSDVEDSAVEDEASHDMAKEAELEAAYDTAFALGAELGRLGLDSDSLEKMANASEEETLDFARFLAQLHIQLNSDES